MARVSWSCSTLSSGQSLIAHCLCILRRGIARAAALIDAETMLDRIAAADSLNDLEAVRVSALGKSGSITALLKSLGAMEPDARANEAPKIHALREQVTNAISNRKSAIEAAELE